MYSSQLCSMHRQSLNSASPRSREVTEILQPRLCFTRVFCVRKLKKLFRQQPGARKVLRVRQHDIHGLAFLGRKTTGPGQQELSAAFKVLSLRRAQLLLNAPADVFERPHAAADEVKPVDDDFFLRQEGLSDLQIRSVHVHDEVFDFAAVGEGFQVGLDGGSGSIRQNIHDFSLFRVGEDALEAFVVRVPV